MNDKYIGMLTKLIIYLFSGASVVFVLSLFYNIGFYARFGMALDECPLTVNDIMLSCIHWIPIGIGFIFITCATIFEPAKYRSIKLSFIDSFSTLFSFRLSFYKFTVFCFFLMVIFVLFFGGMVKLYFLNGYCLIVLLFNQSDVFLPLNKKIISFSFLFLSSCFLVALYADFKASEVLDKPPSAMIIMSNNTIYHAKIINYVESGILYLDDNGTSIGFLPYSSVITVKKSTVSKRFSGMVAPLWEEYINQ